MIVEKEEIIYYELIKMEKRITEKTEAVFRARDEIEKMLNRIEIIHKELIDKIESLR